MQRSRPVGATGDPLEGDFDTGAVIAFYRHLASLADGALVEGLPCPLFAFWGGQDEVIEAFDLPAIGRSPSRFDFVKLENMNGHFMRATPDVELLETLIAALPYLPGGPEIGAKLDAAKRVQLAAAMPGLKERAKTLVELLDGASFLFAERPVAIEDKAEEVLARSGRLYIKALLPRLEALAEWTAAATEAAVRDYAVEQGAKLGVIAQPLRGYRGLTSGIPSPWKFESGEVAEPRTEAEGDDPNE